MMTKEKVILSQIKNLLRLLESTGKLTFTRIHVMPVLRGGGRGKRYMMQNKDMVGFADIEVIANGRIGYIETKRTGAKLTDHQKAFCERVTKHGALWCTAHSVVEATKFLVDEMEIDIALIG